MSTRGGASLALVGLALGVLAAVLLAPLTLPVTADLRGPSAAAVGDRVVLSEVAGRIALLVPALLAGLLLTPAVHDPRLRRLVVVGASAPVAVFLVAQLNGVRDLGALVLVYAATAATVLVRSIPGRWPWSIAAMLGIVPWGVIAFHQVGALVAGGDVPVGVRTVTSLVLVASVVEFVQGREPARGPGLAALPPAVLAAGSLLL